MRALSWIGWLSFAILLTIGGWLMLRACELRPWPLFGYAYCPIPAHGDASKLAAEADRENALKSRLRRAEARWTALPGCRRAGQLAPTPTPTPSPTASAGPTPTPSTEPTPSPTPTPDEMKMPARIDQLKGCWQSERGDISIVSDDEQKRLIGKVRTCYCFDQNNRGTVLESFSDGDNCKGALTVKLGASRLSMHHDTLHCSGNKGNIVAEDIDCQGASGEAATCDIKSLGKMANRGASDERFQRVDAAACQAPGPN